MSIFRNANESAYVGGRKHFTDVIKNSGAGELLVWRQPEEDFNTNSTLVVMPGEQAVFVNEGTVEQVFDSGTYKLSTQNYPFISRLRNMLSGGVSTFNCVVYFVRTTTSVEILWGTDTPLQVRDKLLGIATEVRAHGSYRVQVADAARFLQTSVGNNVAAVSQTDLTRTFGTQFQSTVKALLTDRLNSLDTELLGIEARLGEFSRQVAPYVAEALGEYGLGLVAFNIAALNIADDELRRRYDQIGMDNIEKVRGAQGDKAVLGILGDDWARLTSAEIMKTLASNPGAGGGAADLAGLALGIAAAEPLAAMAQRIMGPDTPAAGAGAAGATAGGAGSAGAGGVGSPADAGAASSAGSTPAGGTAADDPVATLAQLKKMLDLGLIERDDYDAKKAEVLGRMQPGGYCPADTTRRVRPGKCKLANASRQNLRETLARNFLSKCARVSRKFGGRSCRSIDARRRGHRRRGHPPPRRRMSTGCLRRRRAAWAGGPHAACEWSRSWRPIKAGRAHTLPASPPLQGASP